MSVLRARGNSRAVLTVRLSVWAGLCAWVCAWWESVLRGRQAAAQPAENSCRDSLHHLAPKALLAP